MYKPLVSIVIPVYNGDNFLSEAIESALAQTYENIEILVINDGSNDGGATERIALSYGDKIRYYAKENGGVSSALNFGIQKMKGEWFSWLSHDDLYTVDKIERQIIEVSNLIESNNDYFNKNTIVLSNSMIVDEKGYQIKRNKILRKYKIGNYSGTQMFKLVIEQLNINGCALLLPKKCFDDVGLFDTSLKYLQDYEFWYRLMIRNYQFVIIDHISVRTRVHSQQTQAKYPELFYVEREKVGINLVDKLFDDVQKNKDLLIKYLYSCARKGNYKVEKYIFDNASGMNILTFNDKLVCLFGHFQYALVRDAKRIYKFLYNNKYRSGLHD